MLRPASILAALVLVLPGTALAQGAGDDQRQDPFPADRAQAQEPSQGGGDGLSETPPVPGGDGGSDGDDDGSDGGDDDGRRTDPSTGDGEAAGGQGTARAPQGTTGSQLPNTGSDARLLLLWGLAFLLTGVGLRLRTVDPDAF